MPRTKKKVAKAEDNIKEKLEFIGLDLDNIPKNLLEYQNLNYRAMKNYIEKQYKQYRYVDVEDIEILLTPTNRLDPLKEKFEKASPLGCYLDSENEENIMKYAEFINMLKNVEISEIEKIETKEINETEKIEETNNNTEDKEIVEEEKQQDDVEIENEEVKEDNEDQKEEGGQE